MIKLRAIAALHLAKTGRRAFVVEIMTAAMLERPPDDPPADDAALPRLRHVEDHAPRGPPPDAGPPATSDGGRRITTARSNNNNGAPSIEAPGAAPQGRRPERRKAHDSPT